MSEVIIIIDDLSMFHTLALDPIEAMEKWLKTLEPMRPDYRAYERVKGSTGMKPKAMNQSRPVGRPMRSVNRNR